MESSNSDNPFAPPETPAVAVASEYVESADLKTMARGVWFIVVSLMGVGFSLQHAIREFIPPIADLLLLPPTRHHFGTQFWLALLGAGSLGVAGIIVCARVSLHSLARRPLLIVSTLQLVFVLIFLVQAALGSPGRTFGIRAAFAVQSASVFVFIVAIRRLTAFLKYNDLARFTGWLLWITLPAFFIGIAHYTITSHVTVLGLCTGVIEVLASLSAIVAYTRLWYASSPQPRKSTAVRAKNQPG